MNKVFGSVYASAYDALYQDKDYAAECDILYKIFEQYGKIPVRTILDLGCGTCNHIVPLSEHGFEMTGVDCSQEMLIAAKAKIKSRNLPVTLYQADIRDLNLDRTFDSVLMLFAVLGYQLENADVLAALKTARRHLRPGGLLVMDVWYGPAVLYQRPSDRVKITNTSDGKILRVASSEINVHRHTCTVCYHLWRMIGNAIVDETQEEHKVRFFFYQELELFLQLAGFSLVKLSAFNDLDEEPKEDTWNVLAVARAE